jgi:hypothetical protein
MRTWWRAYWKDGYGLPSTLFLLLLLPIVVVIVGAEVAAISCALGVFGCVSYRPGWEDWLFVVIWTPVTIYAVGAPVVAIVMGESKPPQEKGKRR